MATLLFIIPIMPSIAAGSVIGFGRALPLASGLARKDPSLYAWTRYALRAWKDVGDMAFAFVRRLTPRRRLRCSRILPSGCFLGVV